MFSNRAIIAGIRCETRSGNATPNFKARVTGRVPLLTIHRSIERKTATVA
jgi:hypothetical protein